MEQIPSWVFLLPQRLKIIPAFYGFQDLWGAGHLPLYRGKWIPSTLSDFIALLSKLLPLSHLKLGPSVDIFPSDFPIKGSIELSFP
jgi:hypothetical protein